MLKIFKPNIGLSNQIQREKWLEEKLKGIPRKSRILDAGAGSQRYKRFCNHLTYVSQDFGAYKPEDNQAGLISKNFEYGRLDIISDITSIPEPKESFDAIMCVEVLEHLPSPIEAIKEFYRLLKQGGTLILTAPFCSLTHLAPYHFCSGFNRYWYEKHLPEQGFQIDELAPNGNYFEFLGQEIYRLPSLATKYGNKRLKPWHYISMILLLRMLKNLSQASLDTSNLLCFGFHIKATKREK